MCEAIAMSAPMAMSAMRVFPLLSESIWLFFYNPGSVVDATQPNFEPLPHVEWQAF
jgi:hypothetical protein